MDNTKDCSNCGHKDTCATNYCDAIRERLYNIRDGRDCWVPDCDHEWKQGQTSILDPDGWYYNQPCYTVEYICTKCGKKKHIKE